MGQEAAGDLSKQIRMQASRVQALRSSLYTRTDPSAAEDISNQLAEAEAKLRDLQAAKDQPAANLELASPAIPAAPKGRMLGATTTGLQVDTVLNMHPIPTGVYNLLDPETDPLLSVTVVNSGRDPRRVCIRTYLEGLSAQAVKTIELTPRESVSLKLLPSLLPERVAAICEVQRATLHVIAEDLDGKPERHDTYSVLCLARTASFNSVRRPETGEVVDLSHYYGAWVTPHHEAVQERIRKAADLMPDKQIYGYQGDPDGVDKQVEAIFQSLKECGITYINSVIDYGSPAGQSTQRTRLPRESIAGRAANCVDGAVLMASLLEGSSLNAAIVLVPGHAFVGWETWDGSDEWKYLETTMIGGHDFAAACASGQKQIDQAQKYGRAGLRVHRLTDLRARGIWPME